MRVRNAIGASLLAAGLASAADLYASAQQKLDALNQGTAKRGSVVEFSLAEVNAWVRAEVPMAVPSGVRNPVVELGQGTGTGAALVNFLQIRQSKGKETNRLMAWMLNGERPLKVYLRVDSAKGRCTVYLTRVELSGASLSGAPLDYLIQNYFRPMYPEAHIDEPFDLADNIDRIDLTPPAIRVTVKR